MLGVGAVHIISLDGQVRSCELIVRVVIRNGRIHYDGRKKKELEACWDYSHDQDWDETKNLKN